MYIDAWVIIAIVVVLTMLSGTFFACILLSFSCGFFGALGGFFVGVVLALFSDPSTWWAMGLACAFLGGKWGAIGGLGAGLFLTVCSWGSRG